MAAVWLGSRGDGCTDVDRPGKRCTFVHTWRDRQIDKDKWTDRRERERELWLAGWMDGWMEGWMEGWRDAWRDGWMDLVA